MFALARFLIVFSPRLVAVVENHVDHHVIVYIREVSLAMFVEVHYVRLKVCKIIQQSLIFP